MPDSAEAGTPFPIIDAAEESAEELSDTNRSWESAAVESGEATVAQPVVSAPHFLLSTTTVPLSSSAASLAFPLASCLNSMVTPF